ALHERVATEPKGHRRVRQAQARNEATPSNNATSEPNNSLGSVVQKRKTQPTSASNAGNGYNHIRKGISDAGFSRRNRITAPICPMNCTRIRVVNSASISTVRFTKLKAIARPVIRISDKCGKLRVGCSRPNAEKKQPSCAAA